MGKHYLGNDVIYQSIKIYEEKNDLNGFILLMHIGTDAKRTEKLYDILDELIVELESKNYEFVKVNELLDEEYKK